MKKALHNDQIILDSTLAQSKYDLFQDMKDDDYFELFSAEQILKNYDLSYEEIESGIVGGGGDGGIDSIFLFINSELIQEDTDLSTFKKNIVIELFLIQSKTTNGFSEDAMQKFISTTNELLNLSNNLEDYVSVYNSKLLTKTEHFRNAVITLASRMPAINISYYYLTKGMEIHPNVSRHKSTLEKLVKSLFSTANYSFSFLGATDLLAQFRTIPTTTFSLRLSESPIATTDGNSFVSLVSLNDYFNFICNDDRSLSIGLFEANVRDYQGKVEVNKAIEDTLLAQNKEEFWWLNNGVTILAAKAMLSGKTLTLENPQIVNGLQTSREVYEYCKNYDTNDDNRNILIRIIVPEQTLSRDRIIKATNHQTTIPPASLHATEKVHRNIEDYLKSKNLYYDRRKNYYKNEGKPIKKIITIPHLAQAIMAIVLHEPNNARARPTSLLKREEDYKRIFNYSYPIELYYQCAWIALHIEEYLRTTDPILHPKDRNNIRFHMAMYICAILAKSASPTPKELAGMELEIVDDAMLHESRATIFEIYADLGGTDQVAKGTEFPNRVKERIRSTL